VEKFIGDAVMAVFGAPVAHEDDPERAVRAALAIIDALAEDGDAEVRIGITTGEALIALGARPEAGEGIASGDVVNTASRLQAAAPTGGILVDETTYRTTEREIEYRDAAPILAKGKLEPVRVWRALSASPRDALGMNARMGARPWLAHARCDYARMLLARGEPGDRDRPREHATAAGALADELGMDALSASVARLIGSEAPVR
jgi:adenylate/guanylate cyclase family protein